MKPSKSSTFKQMNTLYKVDRITNRVISELRIPITYTGTDQICYIDTTTYYEITQKTTYVVEINDFKLTEKQQCIKNLKQLVPCQQQLQNRFYFTEYTSKGLNIYTYDPKGQKMQKIYNIQQVKNEGVYKIQIMDDKNICIISDGCSYALKINIEKNLCEQIRLPFFANLNTTFYPLSHDKILVISENGLFIYNITFENYQICSQECFGGCEPCIIFQEEQLHITSYQGKLYCIDISDTIDKEFYEKMKKKNLKLIKNSETQLQYKQIINLDNDVDLFVRETQAAIQQFNRQKSVYNDEIQLLRFCQKILTINQFKERSKLLYDELIKIQKPRKDDKTYIEFQCAGDEYTRALQEYQEKAAQVDQYRKELEKQMNKELKQYKKKKEQELQEKKNKEHKQDIVQEQKQEQKQQVKQEIKQEVKQQPQQQKQEIKKEIKQQQKPTIKIQDQPKQNIVDLAKQKQAELEMYKKIQQEEIERMKRDKEEQKLKREMLEKRKQELYNINKSQVNKKFAIIHTFNLFTQGPAYCTILDNRHALIRQGSYLLIFNYLIYKVEQAKTLEYQYTGQPCQYVRKEKRFYEYNDGLIYLDIKTIECQDKIQIGEIMQQQLNDQPNDQLRINSEYKFTSYLYYPTDNSLIFVAEKDNENILSVINLDNYTITYQDIQEQCRLLKDGKQNIIVMGKKSYGINNTQDLLSKEIVQKPSYENKQIIHLKKVQLEVIDNKITTEGKNVYVALNTIDTCKVAYVQNILMFVDDGGIFTTIIVNESQNTEVSMSIQ